MSLSDNYKFLDIKTYCSTEWLANNTKKYRTVFDEQEVSYIYCEFSFINKKFDVQDWALKMQLKCKDSAGLEMCNLNCDRTILKEQNIAYVREGWGVKTIGTYWKAGEYVWEVWVGEELVATKEFYIEKQGKVVRGKNPYFKIQNVKLYEGPDANTTLKERKYYKVFNALSTRYIWVELNAENRVRKSYDWMAELTFNFRAQNGYLKGSISKVLPISPDEDNFSTSIGWGSDMVGTWGRGKYTAEIVFMDEMISSTPFEVGDDYVEALEEDFVPHLQVDFDPQSEKHHPKIQKKEKKESVEDIMKELDGLIGLKSIKTKIKEYSDYLKFISLREKKGFEEKDKINLHAVFRGNPGTGKTTVARMLGKIYKDMGLLKKGHVHEVDRTDLVAEFIGQTAPKTKEAIKKAKDGILFIDEAYSLARKDDDSKDFGKEAIEIILKEMSDNKDFAVIVAGYPSEMETFIESNPGLQSRFNMYYDFPDYVPQELLEIANYSCTLKGVKLSKNAEIEMYKQLVDKYRSRTRFFGNARLVNSIIDEAKMNLGLRVMKVADPSKLSEDTLSTMEKEDIEKVFHSEGLLRADIPVDEALLKESVLKLKGMIGLEEVKQEVEELIKLVRFYKETGKDVRDTFSLHSVFLGNPGTGKTTVARIIAQIFKSLGILERGHLVECDRQSLVGAYIGQTAIKTTELIERSMGGVLFIDEAYALTEGGSSDYGKEAIETLLKRMEDNRGEFIVIAAGYTHNMNQFMESNPGLKSRFDKVFNFADFETEELFSIAMNQLAESNVKPDAKAKKRLKEYIQYLYENKDKYFGNGRAVRKIIEEAIRNQHLRLSELPKNKRTDKAVGTLLLEDISDFKTDNLPTSTMGTIGFKLN